MNRYGRNGRRDPRTIPELKTDRMNYPVDSEEYRSLSAKIARRRR